MIYGFLSFILLVHTRYKSYPTPVFSLLCVLLWGVTWLSGTSTCWVLTYGYLKEVEEPPSFSRDVAIEWKDSMRFMERGDYVLLDNANKTIMFTITNFTMFYGWCLKHQNMAGLWHCFANRFTYWCVLLDKNQLSLTTLALEATPVNFIKQDRRGQCGIHPMS